MSIEDYFLFCMRSGMEREITRARLRELHDSAPQRRDERIAKRAGLTLEEARKLGL